jgi:NAD(P)-dependent dehydrogenase (short-subunit alcohol dehydrogenase family)
MRRRLNGRIALITGAGQGIGRATAVALARRGMFVVLADVNAAGAEETAALIGPAATALALDVTDAAAFADVAAAAIERHGRVDVLVNNAGIMPIGPLIDESPETTRRVLAVNVEGVVNGMRAVLGHMTARGEGQIVNVASVVGYHGSPLAVTYAGSKHAVVGITNTLRRELRGSGVTLTLLCPTWTSTELTHGTSPAKGLPRATPELVAERAVHAIRWRRRVVFAPPSAGASLRVTRTLPLAVEEALALVTHADDALRAPA